MLSCEPKECKPDWVQGQAEVEVDLTAMSPSFENRGVTVAITAQIQAGGDIAHDYVVTLDHDDNKLIKFWVSELELEVDEGPTTRLSVNKFWIADGSKHNYLFLISPKGKIWALREKALAHCSTCTTLVEHSSKSDIQCRLSDFSSLVVGDSEAKHVSSLCDVRVFPQVVAWDIAFPRARGIKRERVEEECVDGMQKLWKMVKFTDFTVSCGGQSFEVHRSVLSAKSTVFAAMLEKAMRETEERCMTIKNTAPETVHALLEYMYVGSVTGSCDEIALLRLADQYGVDGLVRLCGDTIKEKFCEANAADLLLGLAPFHHIAGIKSIFEELLSRSQDVVASSPNILKALVGRASGIELTG